MKMHLQLLQVLKKTAIAAVAMLACAGVQAQTTVYTFGSQISGPNSTTFQPSGTFAQMSVTTTDSMHYVLDLQASASLSTLFGNPNTYINRVVFNTDNTDPVPGSVRLTSGVWGINNIYYLSNNVELGGIVFDFTEGLASGAGSILTSGERVVWQTDFSAPTSFVAPPFAIKVSGIGSDINAYGWYVSNAVSPIPEPETYAMLLAGLGMLGFAARRRQQKEAAAA